MQAAKRGCVFLERGGDEMRVKDRAGAVANCVQLNAFTATMSSRVAFSISFMSALSLAHPIIHLPHGMIRIASQRTYFPLYLRMHWLVIVDFDAIYNPVLPFRAKLHVHGDTNLDAGTNLIVCQGFATPRDISYRFAVTVADGAARLFDDESRAGRIFRDSP
jgi:hypothetical protein